MLPSRIFFDNFFDDLDSPKKINNMMKCDIYETENEYHIEMDTPGFKKEEIKMELSNGYLTITAEKNSNADEQDGKKYIRRERVYTKEMRQFYVGDIDEECVKAEFKNGMLLVSVPKESKEKETKKIINID